jgi:hypothetical protein
LAYNLYKDLIKQRGDEMEAEMVEYEESYMLSDAELETIVREYQKKQMVENLTGPGVSLVSHMMLLILAFVFIATSNPRKDPPLVVETVVVEEIELDKEIVEEIEEIETDEITDEEIAIDNPNPPSEVVSEQSSPEDVSDEAPQTDDQAETEDVLDIVNNNSVMTFPSTMGGRKPAGRAKGVKDGGGSKRGQASVNRALRWLASVQNKDGSWGNKGNDTDCGHTGLALLVFLAHGETPLSEKYGKTVQDAMRWLAEYGNQSDLNVKRRPMGYAHGIATYAISEAYAMTKIPFMQTAMENCVDKLIDGQMGNGGFGYGYTPGPRWDISVAGWNFQALKAARMAGCSHEKLPSAIRKSVNFLKGIGYNGQGNFGYAANEGGNGGSKPNMGGVGTLTLQLLGAGDSPQVREGVERIGKSRLEEYEKVMVDPSKWESIGSHSLYGWYYDTQVVYNNMKKDKDTWKRWRKAFETVLIRAQNEEGYWETKGHGCGPTTPGRVLSTCWAALQLEVYYRYLPTFDKSKIDKFALEDDLINNVGNDGGMVIEIE